MAWRFLKLDFAKWLHISLSPLRSIVYSHTIVKFNRLSTIVQELLLNFETHHVGRAYIYNELALATTQLVLGG